MSSTFLDNIALNETVNAPVDEANRGFLYAKEVSNITELFYLDDLGQEVQITTNGQVLTPANNPDLVESSVTINNGTNNTLVVWDGTTGRTIKEEPSLSIDSGLGILNSDLSISVGTTDTTFISDGYIELSELVNDPTTPLNGGSIYTKEVSGISELFYLDGYGQATQITTDGLVKVSSPVVLPIVSGAQSTSNTSPTGIGITNLNTDQLGASATYTLEIALQVTNASFAGNFELFNITEGGVVTNSDLSTSSLNPTLLTATLTIDAADNLPPAQNNLLEARINLASGAGINDRVICKYAVIKVT